MLIQVQEVKDGLVNSILVFGIDIDGESSHYSYRHKHDHSEFGLVWLRIHAFGDLNFSHD